jgi:hypothetical protein
MTPCEQKQYYLYAYCPCVGSAAYGMGGMNKCEIVKIGDVKIILFNGIIHIIMGGACHVFDL